MQEAGNYMQLNVGELLTSGAIIVALVTWWLTFQQAPPIGKNLSHR